MRRICALTACCVASVALPPATSAFSVGSLAPPGNRRMPQHLPAGTRTRPVAAHGEGEGIDVSKVEDVQFSEEEIAFFAGAKMLCEQRNLPLEKVKNARDLASVGGSPILPGCLYRMGRVSDATEADLSALMDDGIGLRTLVDLRSPTELKDDPSLERAEVFGNFTSIVWTERGGNRDGLLRELPAGVPRLQKKKKKTKAVVDGLKKGIEAARNPWFREAENATAQTIVEVSNMEEMSRLDEQGYEENLPQEGLPAEDRQGLCGLDEDCLGRKERHFVSIMNEFKYVRGTLSKLRKRDIARVLLRNPTAIVSKRARDRVKDVFLDEINDGGLPLLNEFLLRFGHPGVKYVLELCADEERHPVAFYCTAGKDRTGIIAAIILSVLGVPDEAIVEDYSLSANVYAEMNDHKAMVGALSQRNLDPKTFLGAPPDVMRATLEAIRENYGDVEGYLDFIGFGPEKRAQLKKALIT